MAPKISCLMITREARFDLAKKAIQDYVDQTYEPRELIIFAEGGPAYQHQMALLLFGLERDEIKLYGIYGDDPILTIEAMLARATRKMTGSVLCSWHDGDRHPPEWLEHQYTAPE